MSSQKQAPKASAASAKEGSAKKPSTVSKSDKKQPAKPCYYAVRKCNNLNGPAIFTDWEDASFHIDREDYEDPVDYKSFQSLDGAVQFAFGVSLGPAAAASWATPLAYMNAQAAAAMALTNVSTATRTAADSRKRSAQQASLQQPAAKKAPIPIAPAPTIALVSPPPIPAATPTAAAPAAAKSQQEADKAALDSLPPHVREMVAPKQQQSRGRPAGNTESVRKQNWERNFQLLKDYKDTYGTCHVFSSNTKTGKFAGLDAWVRYEQRRIKNHDASKASAENTSRVQRLLDLGLDVPTNEDKKIRLAPGLKRTEKWERNFQAMQEFKAKHDSCDLSKATEKEKDSDAFDKLKQWVRWTSDELIRYESDPSSSALDEDRVKRLQELGFVKRLKREAPAGGKIKCGSWDEMFQQLVAFKEEHGHTNVPHVPRSALRNWTLLQRDHYIKLKEGKKCELDAERVTKLLELGFVLQPAPRLTFDQRAVEWLEYRTKHGCDPTRSDHESLAAWVSKMRRLHSLLKEGKATTLTQEQVDKLTSWGFKWESGFKKPEKVGERKSWDERYAELLEYKEQHGNVNVPQLYPQLGNWVHRQRREYRHLKQGKKSQMTEEKLAKLKAVDFCFLTRKSPGPRRANGSGDGAAAATVEGGESSSEEEEEEEVHHHVGYQQQFHNGPAVMAYAASQHQQQGGYRWM